MNQDQQSFFSEQPSEEYVSRLAPGSVLVATDLLKDPNFSAALILLCLYGKEGGYGLVLNRPSHMPVSEMFDGFSGIEASRKIYVGGPVQQESLQILQVTTTPADEAHKVAKGVYMGGRWDNIHEILGSEDPLMRIFLGYAGWAGGQLEQEIVKGAWKVFNVNVHALLSGPEDDWYGSSLLLQRYLEQLRPD